jgi:hypothetical protein
MAHRDRKLASTSREVQQAEMRFQIHQFLERAAASKVPVPRAQLGNEIWSVYVRLNFRLVDGQVRRTLDAASYEVLYACEVASPVVESWCCRHGWHLVETESPVWPSSYYLLLEDWLRYNRKRTV